MGIRNLLQFVREAIKEGHKLSSYAGKTIGIDLYSWQHCQPLRIYRYVHTRGQDEMLEEHLSDGYVKYCLDRLLKLISVGINVIVVVDGARLDLKNTQRQRREKDRATRRQQAAKLLKEGKRDSAKQELARAFHVTAEIAKPILTTLGQRNIPFIVAPYEADAQLAYLSRANIIDAVLTEDSDLLAFGAKCVLFKTDFKSLTVDELKLDDIPKNCAKFKGWSHCRFVAACILAGCDYLPNLPGVGLATAISMLYKHDSIQETIAQLTSRLGGQTVSVEAYTDAYVRAFLAFRFQRVYCPRSQQCVTLNYFDLKELSQQFLANYHRDFEEKSISVRPWSKEVLDMFMLSELTTHRLDYSFLGRAYSREEIRSIAHGQIDPCTLQPYRDIAFSNKLNYRYWHEQQPKAQTEVEGSKHNIRVTFNKPEEVSKPTQQDSFREHSQNSRFEVRSLASRSPSPLNQTLWLQPPATFNQLFKVDRLPGKRSLPVRNFQKP